ncbi:MAG: NADH-quinone oxidoreductase subunit NuoE, partial [Nitratireductor sp.]|nr:NADH-quinone oxidoreductase subunit NuoE [Nitratireductor sp.]
MSVRRLAEETVQPKDFAFNRANSALAKQWIKKYPDGRQASAVIPLLMIAQEQEGWVTKRAIEHIADMLAMPYIRVLEVATFYTQFMLAPVGTRAHVQVCGTTPCMLRGSEELMAVCREKIHPEQFHTNEEGTLSWEEVECQGACVNAPMVMIFKDTYEDLTPERLAEIIDEFEAGRGDRVTPGPQVNRIHSAPEGGQTTLQKELLVKGAAKPASKPAKAKPAAKAKAVSAKPVAKPGPVRLAKPEGKADDL